MGNMTRWGRGLAVAAVVGLVVTGPTPAGAAGTLDQKQEASGGVAEVNLQGLQGQEVRAGITGSLDQIDIRAWGIAAANPTGLPLVIEVRALTDEGVPGDAVLASESVPASAVPAQEGWISAPFDPPVPVVADQSFALVVASSAPVDSYFIGFASADDSYPGVSFLRSFFVGGPWVIAPGDLAFRTYVTRTPTTLTITQRPEGTGELAARLTTTGGTPVVGATVTFTTPSPPGRPPVVLCAAVTGVTGEARCRPSGSQALLYLLPGARNSDAITATFAGDAAHAGSSATAGPPAPPPPPVRTPR